jgi:hypothetical protein
MVSEDQEMSKQVIAGKRKHATLILRGMKLPEVEERL